MPGTEMTVSNAMPDRVKAAPDGEGLTTLHAAQPGDRLLRFAPNAGSFLKVAAEAAAFVCRIAEGRWAAPAGLACRLEHSCSPNCIVDEELMVVAQQPIPAGERLTIGYNTIPEASWDAERAQLRWLPHWTFDCRCGSPECQGRINGFRIVRAGHVVSSTERLEVRIVEGKGRGVFARRGFTSGEIIERCPVIAMPSEQWEPLDRTRLENYLFRWGAQLDQAACVLGYGMLYNHSFAPSAFYRRVLEEESIHFVALREIAAGEEIQVNYNGDPLDKSEVWFAPVE